MSTGLEGIVNGEPLCCHWWGGTLRILNKHRHGATKYNLKYEVTTIKKQLVKHAGYSGVANCQTKIPVIFWGIFGTFVAFKMFYLFIPRFLAKPLMMLRRTVVAKHCSRWTHVASKQSSHGWSLINTLSETFMVGSDHTWCRHYFLKSLSYVKMEEHIFMWIIII